MRAREFLKDFVLAKLANKFQQIAFILFLGTIQNKVPPVISIIGLSLFILTYFSTYFYNDLMDIKEDREIISSNTSKVLLRGIATEREFISIGMNVGLIGATLTTLWDPLLGITALMSVVLNNIRTHVRNLPLRQLLLVIVELLCLEGFWIALYGELIPGMLLPVVLVYTFMYSALHSIYKQILKNPNNPRAVKEALRKPSFLIPSTSAVISSIFSIPALIKFPFHFFVLLLSFLGYFTFIYFIFLSGKNIVENSLKKVLHYNTLGVSLKKNIDALALRILKLLRIKFSIQSVNNYLLILLGLWILASAIGIKLIPPNYQRSFLVTLTPPRGIYKVVNKVEIAQIELLSSLREVRGLKDTIISKRERARGEATMN